MQTHLGLLVYSTVFVAPLIALVATYACHRAHAVGGRRARYALLARVAPAAFALAGSALAIQGTIAVAGV